MPDKERDVRNGAADDEDGGAQAENSDSKGKRGKANGDEEKKVIWFGLRKGKKGFHRGRRQKGISVNSGSRRSRFADCSCIGGGAWCCLCLKGQRSLDSSMGESPAGDPHSSAFSFGTLRSLIEKNDFYSKDCNPHLVADQKKNK